MISNSIEYEPLRLSLLGLVLLLLIIVSGNNHNTLNIDFEIVLLQNN